MKFYRWKLIEAIQMDHVCDSIERERERSVKHSIIFQSRHRFQTVRAGWTVNNFNSSMQLVFIYFGNKKGEVELDEISS